MVLPSIADVLIVVVLLALGFVAFFLIRYLSAVGRKFSDLETTIWSVFLSFVIYVPLSITIGVSDLDAIRDKIFQPANFLVLMGYTLLVGAVSGVVVRGLRPGMLRGDAWNTAFSRVTRRGGEYAIIYTDNGLEYKGIVHLSGAEEDSKELSLKMPKLILRDPSWKVQDEIPMGEEILFTEKDVGASCSSGN